MTGSSPFLPVSQQCQSPFVASYHKLEPRSTVFFANRRQTGIVGSMADVEAYDFSDERIDLGSGVTLPKSWHARVSGEQDVPGTITVRVEWDAALGRTAVAFAALEREGEGGDITSQVLREVRTHWIMTRSALEVVTVDVGAEHGGEPHRIPVREFLSRVLAQEERAPLETLHAAIAVYRVAMAISYPPLKLVADTLRTSQSTATRLMNRARDSGLAPEVRIQEPRRAPAVDPYNPGRPYDPTAPHYGPSGPGGPSIGR
ncbi:hypothetical protein ACI3KX_00585 [Microbacterium sp. ZW CA_36]|uniref:hypothetical protein n=1 Tax=Microbacterium sp. ZW CA_36 TaxID=3378078 RepID=UPI00385239AF